MAERESSRHASSIDRLHGCQSCVRGFESRTILNKHLLEHAQNCQKKVQIGQRKVDGTTLVSMDFMLTALVDIEVFEEKEHFKENETFREKETFAENDTGLIVNNLISPKEVQKEKPTVSQSNYRLFDCKFCRLLFSSEIELVEHMKKHPVHAPYKCSVCGRDFRSRVDLSKHVLMHNQTAKYKCQHCGKGFIEIGQLAMHQKVHNRLWTHICNVCERGFKNRGELLRHHISHTGQTPFKCDVCDKAFTTALCLKQHSYKHSGNWPHVCEVCGKGFARASHKLSHMNVHDQNRASTFTCNVCKVQFNDRNSFEKHVRQHTESNKLLHMNVHKENKAVTFTCRVCSSKFNDQNSLVKHVRQHTEGRNYKCSFCDRAYFSNGSLKRHMETHTGQYSYRCDHCGHGFCAKTSLKKHIRRKHLKVKIKHMCTVCAKQFTGPKKLQAHMRTHMRDHLKLYHCHLCKARYSLKSSLIYHMQLKHFDELLEKTKSISKEDNAEDHTNSLQGSVTLNPAEIMAKLITCFQCSSCSKVFLDKSSCEVHVEGHNAKGIKCDQCDKKFVNGIELSTHMNIAHSQLNVVNTSLQENCGFDGKDAQAMGNMVGQEEAGAAHVLLLRPDSENLKQPKQCNVCGKVLSSHFNYIVAHLKRHTGGDWPPKCDTCGHTFKSEKILGEHKFTHTKDWPFKCDQCERGFVKKCFLIRHMTVHTKERPHKCEVCNKAFLQKDDRHKHMSVHTGIKPFQCDQCGKTFRLKRTLKYHLESHSRRSSNLQTTRNKQTVPGKQKPTAGTRQMGSVEAQTTPSGEIFYPCMVCLDAFTTKAAFSKHMKTHSSDEQALATSQQEAQIM